MNLTPTQKSAYETLEQRWEDLGFEGLSKPEQRFVALEALAGDTLNGSLDQYFFNSSGDLALLALEALEKLGEADAHLALKSAMTRVWPGDYPTDRIKRQASTVKLDDDDLFDVESQVIVDAHESFICGWLDLLAKSYS